MKEHPIPPSGGISLLRNTCFLLAFLWIIIYNNKITIEPLPHGYIALFLVSYSSNDREDPPSFASLEETQFPEVEVFSWAG